MRPCHVSFSRKRTRSVRTHLLSVLPLQKQIAIIRWLQNVRSRSVYQSRAFLQKQLMSSLCHSRILLIYEILHDWQRHSLIYGFLISNNRFEAQQYGLSAHGIFVKLDINRYSFSASLHFYGASNYTVFNYTLMIYLEYICYCMIFSLNRAFCAVQGCEAGRHQLK